ncbi:hypothetical protein Tco_1085611 [Tanacetum coccineum]
MGCGERVWVSWEGTWDSGLEVKPWDEAVWFLAVNGEGTGWLQGFKRKEWGRGKNAPSSFYLFSFHLAERSGYQQKDRKPSQNDKTEHGMEKTVQNQGQSPKMPKSESILMNQQSNQSRN